MQKCRVTVHWGCAGKEDMDNHPAEAVSVKSFKTHALTVYTCREAKGEMFA